MAWDWLAPLAGAVVGVAGVTAGLLTSRATRQHEVEMERLRHEQAAEERWAQMLADAYLDLLTMADRVGWWANALPDVEPDDSGRIPPFPALDDQPRVRAKLAAFGSTNVRKGWAAYTEIVIKIRKQVESVRHATKGTEASTASDTTESSWPDEKLRHAERTARQALSDQITKELGRRRRSVTVSYDPWIYEPFSAGPVTGRATPWSGWTDVGRYE